MFRSNIKTKVFRTYLQRPCREKWQRSTRESKRSTSVNGSRSRSKVARSHGLKANPSPSQSAGRGIRNPNPDTKEGTEAWKHQFRHKDQKSEINRTSLYICTYTHNHIYACTNAHAHTTHTHNFMFLV